MSAELLSGTDTAPPPVAGLAMAVLDILRVTISQIEGVETVRVLPKDRRHGRDCHKVFVVLGTHDVARDGRIVELMSQIDGVDYDLVPSEAVGMIPDAAAPI